MKSDILIYVAGSLTNNDPAKNSAFGYIENLRRMILWSNKIREAGFYTCVPGLDFLETLVSDNLNYERCFKNSQVQLTRCDGLFLVPGWENSDGTHNEIKLATELSIPVFHSLPHMYEEFFVK